LYPYSVGYLENSLPEDERKSYGTVPVKIQTS